MNVRCAMRRGKCHQRALAYCLIIVALGSAASAEARQSQTALRCGVDQEQKAQRFFADPQGKNKWREYPDLDSVPELNGDEGGALARLWSGSNDNLLVSIEEPGQDFARYTDYCFDRSGQLTQVRFELRTAWGWGYRKEGPILKGSLAPKSSGYFSTKTEMRIASPEQSRDIPDALKPRIYLRKSKIPFFSLLSR
jgi:hypothetical protein